MVRWSASPRAADRSSRRPEDLYDRHHGRYRPARHRCGPRTASNMRRSRLSVGVVLCLVSSAFLARNTYADPAECQEAISEYKSARSDISTALQLYVNCVSSSDGHDDCSSEFEQLKSAQDDFEDSVSKYETECN